MKVQVQPAGEDGSVPTTVPETKEGVAKPKRGPVMEVIWFALIFIVFAVVSAVADYDTIRLVIGYRAMIALGGYLIMQIGLWYTENKWDEGGSATYLEEAGKDKGLTPEELEATEMGDVSISVDKLKASFPIPWGFLIGWWVWGVSYLFPLDGGSDIDPTGYGIAALVVCVLVSIVASLPMADAVMKRKPKQKKMLSLAFLIGWITLGVMSSLDVAKQLQDKDDDAANNRHLIALTADFPALKQFEADVRAATAAAGTAQGQERLRALLATQASGAAKRFSLSFDDFDQAGIWVLCLLGPISIIMSQKILFESRKMGTLWEQSGRPNFHPIVYNMGGPLFVLGWFFFWMGQSGIPGTMDGGDLYAAVPDRTYIPLFLNWRTLLSFVGGCFMVPVVRFLDYSHDEDGPWCGANTEGKVFGKWWLGTDGRYFGIFLESPWPFVLSWGVFGFSCFLTWEDKIDVGVREVIILVNCLAQGVDAGILIQQNLYAGNIKGKKMFSMPFAMLFVALAVNIGSRWDWRALALSLPGAILIVMGQKTVFGARKRGDYTMLNDGKANPYDKVFVYSWGEVFFMMGWIWICWAQSFPTQP